MSEAKEAVVGWYYHHSLPLIILPNYLILLQALSYVCTAATAVEELEATTRTFSLRAFSG